MLRSKWFAILIVFVLLTAPFAASAVLADHDFDPCAFVTLYNGWARATAEGAPNSAVYGLAVNLSQEDDVLVGGSTDAAEVVEIHEMIMGAGDVMQMQPVEGGLPVPARSYVELKPGGYHIMLINLTAPLVAGETLDITLIFEHAGEVNLTVPIVEVTEMGEMGDHDEAEGEHMEVMVTEEAGHDEAEGDHDAAESAHDEASECGALQLVGGWARAAGAGQPNSAAYILIVNPGPEDDHLLSASTDAAETVELHEMVMNGDVMEMSPLEDGIHIPHHSAVVLQPGGLHVMLIGLTQELVDGEEITITLNFEHAGELELTFPVQEVEAMSMGG